MASKIMKRGQTRWRGNVQVNGAMRQKLFATKSEAVAWEAEARKALQRPQGAEEMETPTASWSLFRLATEYLDWCKSTQDKSTYEEKVHCFRLLFEHVSPDLLVEKMTKKDATGYMVKQAKARSGNAANKDRKDFIAAWNWAATQRAEQGFPEVLCPFKSAAKMAETAHPRAVPSLEAFLAALKSTKGQDRVMLETFWQLAARRKEVFGLKWAEIDLHNKTVSIPTRKRKDGSLQYDRVPLSAELVGTLAALKAQREARPGDHVFLVEEGFYGANQCSGEPFKHRQHFMKTLCKNAEVEPFGFHGIRHLAATTLFKSGEPLARIQALLRHKSPTTTERYLQKLGLTEVSVSVNVLAGITSPENGKHKTQEAAGF
ncbi:MAG TPA: site-specific integrase [Humidesulfovibrio sp.]|uniref:tyrosine-type recombinase/integrase n=1 Tax=Humidesulfovibrio sp. TaxID=2910988 RepID=UPI002CE86AFA|nr:site-specific integrase [Humidesulfovibrio sp.]HWR03288.1 site-specific integrase [Humidesulfovibrio sp.]